MQNRKPFAVVCVLIKFVVPSAVVVKEFETKTEAQNYLREKHEKLLEQSGDEVDMSEVKDDEATIIFTNTDIWHGTIINQNTETQNIPAAVGTKED